MWGKIESDRLITEKQSYDAMLYFLKNFQELTGSNNVSDILGGAMYLMEEDSPGDPIFWDYWLEAIEQVRKFGSLPPLTLTKNVNFE